MYCIQYINYPDLFFLGVGDRWCVHSNGLHISYFKGKGLIEAGCEIENLWYMYLNQNYFYIFSVSDFLMGEQDMVLSESAMSKQHSRVCRFYYYHYHPE